MSRANKNKRKTAKKANFRDRAKRDQMRRVRTSAHSYAPHPRIVKGAIENFFEALDTPISLQALALFTEGRHRELLDLDINPADYGSDQADLFHRDYCAISFLSKYQGLTTGYDTKARALAKFDLFETKCAETNQRFKSYAKLESSAYATWLFVMRRKIDLILGEFPVEDFFDKASWGPGVSTSIKGRDTSAARKYQHEAGITLEAYSLLGPALSAAYPSWFVEGRKTEQLLCYEVGNTIDTVPKNSKTDRVIAVEPGLNLYFQKGVGAILKDRLRRRGIDLQKGQSKNGGYAFEGSVTGSLATVDFSSASDSIAREVVKNILPETWHTVLNALRCKFGQREGSTFEWEKFSSMGNGFTFELESLLFYAAALTTCDMLELPSKDVSVYGDDVIIPTDAFSAYSEFCAFLGFTVNGEKSFSSGHFRESCGSHYFGGVDVKPFYLKEVPTDAEDIFHLANGIRRLAHRRCFNNGCDARFLATWRCILKGLPKLLSELRIPEGYGDGGILSNFDEACPEPAGNGWWGHRTLHLTRRSGRSYHDSHGLLLERLGKSTARLPDRRPVSWIAFKERADKALTLAYGNAATLRDQTKVAVGNLFVQQWYNMGGWD